MFYHGKPVADGPRNFNKGIGSLFDPCVNAMGQQPYCPSRMVARNCTFGFGAIIRCDLRTLSLPRDSSPRGKGNSRLAKLFCGLSYDMTARWPPQQIPPLNFLEMDRNLFCVRLKKVWSCMWTVQYQTQVAPWGGGRAVWPWCKHHWHRLPGYALKSGIQEPAESVSPVNLSIIVNISLTCAKQMIYSLILIHHTTHHTNQTKLRQKCTIISLLHLLVLQ